MTEYATKILISEQALLRNRVVIDTMFIYHFIDPKPGVEIFFEKEGATECVDFEGGVDFEMGS